MHEKLSHRWIIEDGEEYMEVNAPIFLFENFQDKKFFLES